MRQPPEEAEGDAGRDYGRYRVEDDEGAAEGGIKGRHVAQTGHKEGGGGASNVGAGGEGTGLGAGMPSAAEMGRRAGRAMEEHMGCVERGEVRARGPGRCERGADPPLQMRAARMCHWPPPAEVAINTFGPTTLPFAIADDAAV